MPKIKCENAFGESYGKTTGQSVGGLVSQGIDQSPAEKYVSMSQQKYTDQHVMTRQMRPADTFEPGYDTIKFESPKKTFAKMSQPTGQITLSYQEAMARAHGEKAAAQSQLTSSVAPTQAGPHLKQPSDIRSMVVFPPGTKSLLSKYLTPEVYNKYRGRKDAAGVSFEQMILSGAQNVDSGIGVYAGSHDSYYSFDGLFDKIIEHYHKHGKTDKHISNMDYTQLHCPPFTP